LALVGNAPGILIPLSSLSSFGSLPFDLIGRRRRLFCTLFLSSSSSARSFDISSTPSPPESESVSFGITGEGLAEESDDESCRSSPPSRSPSSYTESELDEARSGRGCRGGIGVKSLVDW
jgi:hypothetical protein